jgi:hypothetical protein
MAKTAIGPFVFATKKAAEAEIRRILHDSPLRSPLRGVDAELITALVSNHPHAAEKIGSGIRHIDVRIIDYGQRGFWITHTDNSSCDFSYRRALDGALTPRAQCLQAMRSAVRDQIEEFRRQEFSRHIIIVCPLTDEDLTANDRTHVDHINDFALLAEAFVICHTEGYDSIPIGSSPTHPGPALTEPTLSAWQKFHAEQARLRIVHPSANLARARGGIA